MATSICSVGNPNKGTNFCSLGEVRKAVEEFSSDGTLSGALKKAKVRSETQLLQNPEFLAFCNERGLSPALVEKHFKEIFAPTGPHKCCDLLSNFNIEDALRDLRTKYDWLYIHPCNMINFEEYGGSLTTVPAGEYLKYKAMACVLNTDVDNGRGKHWVCIFCDFRHPDKGYSFEFFNSSGNGPGTVRDKIKRDGTKGDVYGIIMNFLDVLANDINRSTGVPCRAVIATDVRNPHQKSDTECGPYCLYYIHMRCRGVSYKKFRDERIPDEVVTDFRAFVFRPES
ncbi:hypothetical protein KDA11_05920 [Candidatus Saccharibacteria bacterium]|nr:hypothetical protein [Candidatus Saccharibacteria bacterium]